MVIFYRYWQHIKFRKSFKMGLKKIKYLYVVLISLLFYNFSFSQQDTTRYIVTYSTEHLIDTGNKNSVIKYPLYLLIGERITLSLSKNQYANDSINDAYKQIGEKNRSNLSIDYTRGSIKRISAFESAAIYADMYKGVFYETNVIGTTRYLIDDSIKTINWKIMNNYKEIQGFKCQEARTVFKCRTWIVWFSNELAVSSGPWKLNGLPGLILEAFDESRQISFVVNDIAKYNSQKIIELPEKGYTKCSRREFYRLLSAYAENPMKFVENQTGFVFKDNADNPPPGLPRLKLPNNPIEKCSN